MAGDRWYRNAVIYSLAVDAFMDGDGDGWGDFSGLRRRLDYLESLGVDALWLTPFQTSPNRDDGYDVADYYSVDPRFGSGGEFVEFMHEAESRGLRVLVDLVVNHTSDRHPWFLQARSDRRSRFHDWYVWDRKRPPNWKSGVVFPGVQKETWTYAREVREYYFHRFYDFEPDLNMANPRVREEVRRVIGYWLQLGVAGFRMDAVPFVLEKPSMGRGPSETCFEWLREFREFLQWRSGDAVLLGEANVEPRDSAKYFAGGDGLHMMFNFWVNQHLFYALASGDARPLARALRATRALPPGAQWAHFLRNHDELDLGRLGDEEREEAFAAFAPEPRMQLYGRGIRRRLAPMLGERARIELAYSLLLSLPGTPVLRYGDEIGMGEDLALEERNAIRTPMQWSHEANAGFSTADRLIRPVLSRGPYSYESVNVEAQRRDPSSLLRWLERMIGLRKETPEIGWGEWQLIATRNRHVLALAYTWRENTILSLHNLDREAHEVTLRLPHDDKPLLTNLIEQEEHRAASDGTHTLTLDAYGYRWYRLGGLDYALGQR